MSFSQPLANVLLASFVAAVCFIVPSSSLAVVPSEQLFPETTKAYLSIPDYDRLVADFNKTDLGHLTNDPVMKPFIEDLKKQINTKLNKAGVKMGLKLSDLEGVYGGEIGLAAIQPGGVSTAHARALVVDITGKQKEADELLAKVDANMKDRKAKKTVTDVEGVSLTTYETPPAEGEREPSFAYYFVKNNQLVACDHGKTVLEILARTGGPAKGDLAQVPAFAAAMKRCQEAAGELAPHARWFIEPFGYTEVSRAAQGGRKKRGTDFSKVLQNQGFDAVQGLGGYITFNTGDHDILHRTLVYAPPVEDAEEGESYKLAARMLDFQEVDDLSPQDFFPRELATYMTLSVKLQEAFFHSKTLVNELAGDEVFEDVLDSIRDDPNGPMVDLRGDLVKHLKDRVTLVTDYQLPITPQSERMLVAIDVADTRGAAESEFDELDEDRDRRLTENEYPRRRKLYFRRLLKKFDDDQDGALTKEQYVKAKSITTVINMAMESDPDARKLVVNDHVIWEIIEEPAEELPALEISGPGFAAIGDEGFGEDEEEEEEQERLFPNQAITFAHDRVMVATNVDFLVKVLEQGPDADRLSGSADYRLVNAALKKLGSNNKHFLETFSRTDEEYRATYELFKQGRMPEAETLLGRMLNRVLGPEEEGELREQQIDGGKLPEYQVVRRYLGPAGMFMNSQPNADGWFLTGCVLGKGGAAK